MSQGGQGVAETPIVSKGLIFLNLSTCPPENKLVFGRPDEC